MNRMFSAVTVGLLTATSLFAQQTTPPPAATAKPTATAASTAPAPAATTPAATATDAAAPAAKASTAKPALKDLKAKVSYIVGLNLGRQLHGDNMEIDPDVFVLGLKDAYADVEPALTREEMQVVFEEFQKLRTAAEVASHKAELDRNTKAGADFLAANGKKEGIVTLPSGVQYKVLKSGSGPTPKATDTVTTHYEGKLLDGTVFDSSYDRGQPASFPVDGVIKGWTEVLQKMKAGDSWEVYIPGEHAYGANGQPSGGIGPNALLIFKIELIGVEAAPKPE